MNLRNQVIGQSRVGRGSRRANAGCVSRPKLGRSLALPGNVTKTDGLRNQIKNSGRGAFTLTEVLVSLAVSGFLFISLFAGLSQGTSSLKLAREKLRGTQILTEKLEVIRLYNWDQVNQAGYIPSTFTEHQYPVLDTNNAAGLGIAYTGTIVVGPADVHPAYTNTMRKVVATVQWVSSTHTNQQRMETFISEFGVQKYVY